MYSNWKSQNYLQCAGGKAGARVEGGAGGETGARVEAGAEGKAGAGGEVRFKNLDVTLEFGIW